MSGATRAGAVDPAALAEQLCSAWQQAAGQLAGAMVRDPQMLAAGAAALQAQLSWKQACDATLAAAWAAGLAAGAPLRAAGRNS